MWQGQFSLAGAVDSTTWGSGFLTEHPAGGRRLLQSAEANPDRPALRGAGGGGAECLQVSLPPACGHVEGPPVNDSGV